MSRRELKNLKFLKKGQSDSSTFDVGLYVPIIETPILARCFVSTVIPVRDEAENLSETLESFTNQIDLQNLPLAPDIFEVIVLVNNSGDNSAAIAADWQSKNPTFNFHFAEINLPDENANIGFVRRLLMNEAYFRLTSNKFGGGIIATTDGDTQISDDWIANIVGEIENGADAVGGRILIDEKEFNLLDEKTRSFHLFDEEYRMLAAELEDFCDNLPHDCNPRHHQHFNGSFAVKTDAFERAGGIPAVKFLEDVAFYKALLRIDAKFRHSPKVKVCTSARNRGRTALGLSTQFSEWQIMGRNGDVYLVESAQTVEKKFTARRKLRSFWHPAKSEKLFDSPEISTLAEQLCISEANLITMLKNSETFGILMEKITEEQIAGGQWKRQNPLISVDAAIFDLREKLAEFYSAEKARKKSA